MRFWRRYERGSPEHIAEVQRRSIKGAIRIVSAEGHGPRTADARRLALESIERLKRNGRSTSEGKS